MRAVQHAAIPLSPDGYYYLRAAAGDAVPHPYRLRWLLPLLLGARPDRWAALSIASLATLPAAAWFYFHAMGLSEWPCAFAAALLSALPALRLPLRLPVLLDAPSFTGALLVAAATHASPLLACALALPLGAMRETAPVFAAVWAWSPWPLVGVVACGWWRRSAWPTEAWLTHPVRAALELRRRVGMDGSVYVRPWGAALAGLCAPSWQLAAALLASHAPLLFAQDTLRLTVWAAPVLVLAAVKVLPLWAAPLALVVTALHREPRV